MIDKLDTSIRCENTEYENALQTANNRLKALEEINQMIMHLNANRCQALSSAAASGKDDQMGAWKMYTHRGTAFGLM